MFGPMNPMTERSRINNERQMVDNQATPRALPGKNMLTALRAALHTERSETTEQPVAEPRWAEQV